MKIKQQMKSVLLLAAVLLCGIYSAKGQTMDTTKICATQALTVADTQALNGQGNGTFTYQWYDGTGAAISGATDSAYSIVSAATANTTASPIFKTYKLVVSQTGGATCPSLGYTKVLVIYPPLTTVASSTTGFYCVGNPIAIVIHDTTKANSNTVVPVAAPSGQYGVLAYTWTPQGTAPTGTSAATSVGSDFTIAVGNFPATAGTYTYDVTAKYADTILGSGTALAGCTADATASVHINAVPTINTTKVAVTFQ